MKAGRKNMKKVFEKDATSVQEGHSIMQVVSLRGSNLIEVVDCEGVKSLAMFPAKFRKSVWIKRGNFVIVDESGRDEAFESGSKITCMVSQVLSHGQVRALEKSSECPAIFKVKITDDSKDQRQVASTMKKEEDLTLEEEDDDDDLPPLEANLNRSRPVELYSDSDSSADCEL